jgi:HTH-type transcriptional regulator/antitoxin HipB
VDYPVKIASQLRPLLVGFRKAAGFTQADVAIRLGVTQQTYAQLEAKPESASMDRLFTVLRLFNVEMTLSLPSEHSREGGESSSKHEVIDGRSGKPREDW